MDITMTLVETIAAKKGAWTIAELSELLGCSTAKLYDLVDAGNIPFFRLGRMIRFDPTETAAWLEERNLTMKMLNLEGKRRRKEETSR